jgi:hypothetical protein
MNCISKPAKDSERAINSLLAVVQLLEEPQLARLYTFVLHEEEVTIDDVVDSLEMPRTTAYSDTGALVELGVLTRDEEQKTDTFSAVPVTLTVNLDGDECTVTPTLIEAFGRPPQDQNLDLLLKQHGPGKLAAALTYAVPYAEAVLSERVATQELNLQHAFAIAVLQALREAVLKIKPVDPYSSRFQIPASARLRTKNDGLLRDGSFTCHKQGIARLKD